MSGEERAAFERAFYDQLDSVSDEPDTSIPEQDDAGISDERNATESGSRADGADVQDNVEQHGSTDADGQSEDATDYDREETDEGTSTGSADSQIESGSGERTDIADERTGTQDTTNEGSSNVRTFAAIPHVYDFESNNI